MTTGHFLVLMIIAALLQGASLARQTIPESQQATPQSYKEPASAAESHPERSNLAHRVTVPQSRAGQKHSIQHLSHPVRSAKATGSVRGQATGKVINLRQTGATTSTDSPSKTVNRRSVPVSGSSVALNGNHFKNNRDPGARLAISGGPLTGTKGTAVINGTNMKHNP